jgi:uncharacterized membrane protein
MRVEQSIAIEASPEAIWELVSDPARYPSFMSGITRFDVAGDHVDGAGARYMMRMHVGSAQVGGEVEIVEYDAPNDMAWTSVTGIDQRGRWRLRARPEGRTHVELRLSYGVAGSGLFGWLAERVAAPTVQDNLRRSLHQLKRQVEHEQLRRQAGERRSARAGVG